MLGKGSPLFFQDLNLIKELLNVLLHWVWKNIKAYALKKHEAFADVRAFFIFNV